MPMHCFGDQSSSPTLKRVYVDIVGDLFHYGHIEIFKKAKEQGDILVVGIHNDDIVASYKRRPILTMDERIKVVEACRYVDEVAPNAPLHITDEWLDKLKIDLVIHGDDIDPASIKEWYGVPYKRGIFKTVPYTPEISTTEIIRRIKVRENLNIDKQPFAFKQYKCNQRG